MRWTNQIVSGVRSFMMESVEEVKKCTWPTKDQLLESTLLVIFQLILVSLFVALVDQILIYILKWLTA